MVLFRENTEDLYAGIEFEAGGPDARQVLNFLKENFPAMYQKVRFPQTSGIGFKPVSQEGSERLIRAAINYAIANKRQSVTLVHKGNILKFTEGAFRNWGYALADREFPTQTYTWEQWERTKAAKGEAAANAEQQAALAMLRYLGWTEAADLIIKALDGTISEKIVTYDFARLLAGAREVKCSEFGDALIAHM